MLQLVGTAHAHVKGTPDGTRGVRLLRHSEVIHPFSIVLETL